MPDENILKAAAYIQLVLAERANRLWPEEVTALQRALAVLNRFN